MTEPNSLRYHPECIPMDFDGLGIIAVYYYTTLADYDQFVMVSNLWNRAIMCAKRRVLPNLIDPILARKSDTETDQIFSANILKKHGFIFTAFNRITIFLKNSSVMRIRSEFEKGNNGFLEYCTAPCIYPSDSESVESKN